MNLLEYLVLGLSTWRISNFLVNETGPWNIFVFFREIFWIQHDEDGNIVSWSGIGNFFGPLFDCMYCTSVWVGIIVYVFYIDFPGTFPLHVALSLSTVAILVNTYTNR